jgi:hypothetical protein
LLWLLARCGSKINEWLYFDSKESPVEIKGQIRFYFDELLPTEPIALAELYCRGWHADFHDPDSTYDDTASDFEYPIRMSLELANKIAADEKLLDRALESFATSDAKSVFGFARRLVSRCIAIGFSSLSA